MRWSAHHSAAKLGERPERVLIFLWSPLAVIEIAHSVHVDAVYLPLIVGAMLLRATAPPDRVNPWSEIGIGVLLGAAVLTKLYPAILLVPLWSVRDSEGRRRWRLLLPIAAALTVAAGYALYLAPGVDTLGFLSSYSREFFNVAPFTLAVMQWVPLHGLPYYVPVNVLMPLGIAVASLYFLIVPARSARQSILRCAVPIAIYLLISQNLFSWYVLWMLPLMALALKPGRWLGFALNGAFAWWLFSGLVALSYTLFITGYAQDWVSWLEFIPLYRLAADPAAQGTLHKTFRPSICTGGHMTRRALMVVAKQPAPGQTKTRLSPPLDGTEASALYECFLRDTLDIIRQAQHMIDFDPIIAYLPAGAEGYFRTLAPDFGLLLQQGNDLSERLHNATAHCLTNGYDQAVIMDSDSPTLPASSLRDAFTASTARRMCRSARVTTAATT